MNQMNRMMLNKNQLEERVMQFQIHKSSWWSRWILKLVFKFNYLFIYELLDLFKLRINFYHLNNNSNLFVIYGS